MPKRQKGFKKKMKISIDKLKEIAPLLLRLEFPDQMNEADRKIVRQFMNDLCDSCRLEEK
jgi:hypothetical protein